MILHEIWKENLLVIWEDDQCAYLDDAYKIFFCFSLLQIIHLLFLVPLRATITKGNESSFRFFPLHFFAWQRFVDWCSTSILGCDLYSSWEWVELCTASLCFDTVGLLAWPGFLEFLSCWIATASVFGLNCKYQVIENVSFCHIHCKKSKDNIEKALRWNMESHFTF